MEGCGGTVPIEGCTVKLNVLLRELPNFVARPGVDAPHHYGQINAPLTHAEWKAGYAAARRGELPEHLWCELYFQSVHDATVAPAGQHTMSVFAQYVPYRFAQGTWDERREEVKRLAMKSLARFCSNLDTAVIDAQVLGPPDIEERVGLTGGHIFQGECLPPYMWSKRLTARTPMQGGVSVRSVHASRGKRDWDQWAECGDGGAAGPGALAGEPAAVDVEDGAGDVVRCRRGEKDGAGGDVTGISPTAGRDAFEDLAVAGLIVA